MSSASASLKIKIGTRDPAWKSSSNVSTPWLSGNVRSSTTAPTPPLRKRSIPLERSVTHSTRNRASVRELNSSNILAASPVSASISRTHSSLSFVFVWIAVLSAGFGILLNPSKNVLLALGLVGSIRGHKPQHLLLQLRIHLVRDRH